jgi:hypothetical protein
MDFNQNPKPVSITGNDVDYAVFPLKVPPGNAFLEPKGFINAEGLPKVIKDTLLADFQPVKFPKVIAGASITFKPTTEQDELLNLIYKMDVPVETYRVVFTVTKDGNKVNATQEDNAELITKPKDYKAKCDGTITPLHLICADINIVSPTGPLPQIGEAGANANPANFSSLLVFDKPNNAGKCEVVCEATQLAKLSAEAKSIVWGEALEWVPAKRGDGIDVSGVVQTLVPGHPWKTKMVYPTMPKLNTAFGNTTDDGDPVILRFKDRPEWKWEQHVQFRFHRVGTGAAAEYKAHDDYTKIFPLDEGAKLNDYPNWHFYWHQVADGIPSEYGGTFGCKATRMYYNPLEQIEDGGVGQYQVINRTQWEDKITLYNYCRQNIVEFARVLHHENGHPQTLGHNVCGFGTDANGKPAWTRDKDEDRDGIPDLGESNSVIGKAVGFQISLPPRDPSSRERAKLEDGWYTNWQHGWMTATDIVNKVPNVDYNHDGWVANDDGCGLTIRNEKEVQKPANQSKFREKDWSHLP